MYSYRFIEWLAFFYLYCFAGWCFESTFVSLRNKRFVNRGFMRGPFLPLYGTGAIMMLLVSAPFHDNIVLTFMAGVIGATILEYVTAVFMESLFKVKYWDYSKQKFNFQGRICLTSSLAWGGLTVFMTFLLHRYTERLVTSAPSGVLYTIVIMITMIETMDFLLSFRAAIELRSILQRAEKIKEEFEKGVNSVQERLTDFMKQLNGVYIKWAFLDKVGKSKWMVKLKHSYRRALLRGNPRMTSKKFGATLMELREAILNRRKDHGSKETSKEEDMQK